MSCGPPVSRRAGALLTTMWVSTSSMRVRRIIRPMACSHLLACKIQSPNIPSVLPPPRAPPKNTSNTEALQQFPLCPICRRVTKSPAQLRPRSLQGNLACPVLRQPLFFGEHVGKLRHIAVCRIRLLRSASSRLRKPASMIPSASVRAPCGNQSIHRPGASFRKAAGPPKLTLHQFRQDRAGHNAADEEARRFSRTGTLRRLAR
jgi:hypothetical protein